jgi:hypothetical protein
MAAGQQILADFYAGDKSSGLFRPEPCSVPDQDLLLGALDKHLGAEARAAADTVGGVVGLELEVRAAAASMPRNKRPGHDGLPYEFYHTFWDELGPELCRVFQESLAQGALPPSMLLGLVSLIFKGSPLAPDKVASYRPITLLCADYKLLARAVGSKLGSALSDVIDPTQTGFLPHRWIGDNTLFHLELAEYLQRVQQPGALLFLDFAKAYDRVHRDWLWRCMEALGFGPSAVQWVRLLHQGTQAQVLCNGLRTRAFPVLRGLPQGSPLSPILFVLQAQPLAALLRRLQGAGSIRGIPMPGGGWAPPSLQHADDVTVNAADLPSLAVMVDQGFRPYERASNAQLNIPKSEGLVLGSHPPVQGPEPTTGGAKFLGPAEPRRHLGARLGVNMPLAHEQLWAERRKGVRHAAFIWRKHHLSYMGRVHVAKSVLASKLYYHATVQPPTAAELKPVATDIQRYIRALADDDDGPYPMMHPCAAVAAMPKVEGGVGAPDVAVQIAALNAKVMLRLLDPTPAPWKPLFLANMRAAALPTCPVPAELVPCYATPAALCLRPGRYLAFAAALQAARPHRVLPPGLQSFHSAMLEPLAGNARVLRAGRPLAPQDLPAAGGGQLRTLQQLRDVWQGDPAQRQGQQLQRLLEALPPPWRAHVQAPAPPLARHYCSDDDRWVCDRPSPAHGGAAVWLVRPACPAADPAQVQDVPQQVLQGAWHPCCMAEGGYKPYAPAGMAGRRLNFMGRWSGLACDLSNWRCGRTALLLMAVKDARRRMLRMRLAADPRWSRLYVPGRGIRPVLWPEPGGAAPGAAAGRADLQGGIPGLEQHWADVLGRPLVPQPGAAVAPRRAGDQGLRPEYDAPWMHPSPARQPPLDRALRAAQAGPSALAGALPPDAAAVPVAAAAGQWLSDTDALALPGGPPAPPSYRRVWERLHGQLGLPRPAVCSAWRVLHGVLYCGAFRARLDDRLPARAACCMCPGCEGHLDTLSHSFVTCPAVGPAADWLLALWGAVAGQPPLKDARVLLADDDRVWRPEVGGACLWPLWSAMRVLYLHAVWCCRTGQRLRGAPFGARQVVGMLVALLRKHIQQDWARALRAPVSEPDLQAHWVRGGYGQAWTVQRFRDKWCLGDVLARVDGQPDGSHLVHVRLSMAHPVVAPA